MTTPRKRRRKAFGPKRTACGLLVLVASTTRRECPLCVLRDMRRRGEYRGGRRRAGPDTLISQLVPNAAVTHRLLSLDKPTLDDREAIAAPLCAYNRGHAALTDMLPVIILLRDEHGQTVGGLWGKTMFDWLYVESLTVPESLRGQDVGTALMLAERTLPPRQDTGTARWIFAVTPAFRRSRPKAGTTRRFASQSRFAPS